MLSRTVVDGIATIMIVAFLPFQSHAQSIDESFGADLLIGYGTDGAYASGYGIRLGSRVTAPGRRGLILAARAMWHFGAPFETFAELGSTTYRAEVDESVSYYALELGPVWFYGEEAKLRFRAFALIGAAFTSTTIRFGDPPFHSRGSSSGGDLFWGPCLEISIRFWRMNVGSGFGLVPTPDLETVFIYGHIGGLWDG